MKILTGQNLASGDVVWWTGSGWSLHLFDAVDVGETGAAIAATEEKALRVNVPYVIDAVQTADGPMPAHIKDRIRAAGPTVHPAFAIHPEIPILKTPARHQSNADAPSEVKAN
ncbi:DUF2849 domain-containing protein [Sphingomonas montana]|uniref:DUF2849 domain-containing protein n=1 Tax=Sphingomonas montana TaxID=1843236 RepID=UPI00096C7FE9|nr:DUF2849 domain-containing protein [Sphingomonas montana]